MNKPGTGGVSRRAFLASMGAVAAGLKFAPGSVFAAEEKKLNFYNWDTYIGEDTLSDFKDATGIDVTMDLFADNDELFAKLKGGNPGYDVIVPTNDFVERMITAGMLMPLDHGKIPNIANVDPTFRDAAFDPGRKYSLPYMWGTIGIGYRKSKVDGTPDDWKWILDSDRHSGQIALMGDGTTMIQMTMKYLGYPLNESDPARIKEAEALLIKQKPNVKVF
ncbi:MAG: spermidine/putrescine ABC transporter substrate-binding protein, partial [Gammaproteobacteria bacterium]